MILARHEQNAAFMAQAIGRLTGEPGVVIATSGPGASNLATGLVTATAEGDPVLALAGQVKRSDLSKLTHQSMNNAALFSPITKYSTEIKIPKHYLKISQMHFESLKPQKRCQFSVDTTRCNGWPSRGSAIRSHYQRQN